MSVVTVMQQQVSLAAEGGSVWDSSPCFSASEEEKSPGPELSISGNGIEERWVEWDSRHEGSICAFSLICLSVLGAERCLVYTLDYLWTDMVM